MRPILILLLTLLWQPFTPQPFIIIEEAPPAGLSGSASSPDGDDLRIPVICDPTLTSTIQFIWVTLPGEATDRDAVERQLHEIAEQVNWKFWRDSDRVDLVRLPAWKVTPDCRLDVRFDGAPVWGGTIPAAGQTKLIQVDTDVTRCGWAFVFDDDRPTPDNVHNQGSFMVATRVCLNAYVVAHEFLHSIGAVQMGAPHSDGGFHSSEFDIMGRPAFNRCGVHDMIDCGHDDYFSLQPTGYLAEHWNSADSVFLVDVPRVTVWLPLWAGNGARAAP